MTDLGLSEPSAVVSLTVNGEEVTAEVPTRMHLADFLRHRLGLTGTHLGCEQGVCGMCTVLVDGAAVKSCLMLVPQTDRSRVETVESLAPDEGFHPLQQAFKEEHGLQCGFCTPAFLMTTLALSRNGPPPDREQLKDELAGVMCRCTGYEFILRAVERYLRATTTGPEERA